MKIEDIQEMLNGYEVHSITMEGVVGYWNKKWHQGGYEIFPTDKQIRKIYKEYVKYELSEI